VPASQPKQPLPIAQIAYPKGLADRELELRCKRYGLTADWAGWLPPAVGFGLSGGGIRSATFCLGVFQALANKAGLLHKIDYISSVSGGGFFAGFFGRLLSRPDVSDIGEVEKILSPDQNRQRGFPDVAVGGSMVHNWKTEVFRSLRENGRYLAPNGSGDLLTGVAVFLRNWVTVQLLLSVSIIAVLLFIQLIRIGLHRSIGCAGLDVSSLFILSKGWFWTSPFIYLPCLMAVFLVVPLGWGYWAFAEPDLIKAESGTVQLNSKRPVLATAWKKLKLAAPIVIRGAALWSLVFILSAAALIAYYFSPKPATVRLSGGAAAIILAVLLIFCAMALPEDHENEDERSDMARTRLSQWLRVVLAAAFALLAFALLDSVGQTLYALSFTPGFRPSHWLIVIIGGIATAVPFAHTIASSFTPKKGTHVSLPLALLAIVGAILVYFPFLVSLDCFSHAIAYRFRAPADAPVCLVANYGQSKWIACDESKSGSLNDPLKPNACSDPCGYAPQRPQASNVSWGGRRFRPVASLLILALVFSLVVGWSKSKIGWVFLNRTSLHSLYCARLIRAYLGASNKYRHTPMLAELEAGASARPDAAHGTANSPYTPVGVSDPIAGDDIAQEDYWRPVDPRFWQAGAPLHLVNVTINETIDGRSQTEQRDRKGVGMAIGPAGFSAGVQHHVVAQSRLGPAQTAPGIKIYPEVGDGFRVFAPDEGPDVFDGEQASLGKWTAISGAAVSTGLGSRNSLGASLLTGFFNVRLGYWWDSGTRSIVVGNKRTRRLGRRFVERLPVQSSLLDEFLGRFRGTLRRYWYLTDGGHFENMAGYELIRRRLPLIVLIDCGADPDYDFVDLANLTRKARLDFNAEVNFLDPDAAEDSADSKEFSSAMAAVSGYFHPMDKKVFGTIGQLRRGKWATEPFPNPKRRDFIKSSNPSRLSARHAALARIRYLDDPGKVSYLVLLKPSLIGEEPQDLLNYHSANPDFPQQATSEQFFDEAQWESYRRLGQHVTERVFGIG